MLLFISPSLNAQDPTSLAGKYALQFQVSQNFTLSSFMGSVISGKYHLTNKNAIRIGLGFSSTMGNQSSVTQYSSGASDVNNVSEGNSQSVDITAQYMITPVISDKIRFYCGAGPKFGLNFSKINNTSNAVNTSQYIDKQNTKGYSAGIMCSAGVEWFFSSKMSLCAEYGLTYVYSYAKITGDYNGSYTATQETYKYSFDGNNVRFGLSVYF
jgi:hypothetical protein